MLDPVLDSSPLWAIAILIIVACIGAREIGLLIRKKAAAKPTVETEKSDMESYIVGSIFGLLAFMLGLTFSLSLDRYDTRKHLVYDEANALSTTYMRLSLFDEPTASQTRELMRQYVHTRIAPDGMWGDQMAAQLQQSRDVRERLWRQIRVGLWPWRATDFGSNILEPMNESFDLGTKRELMGRSHIPTTIVEVLLLYTLISAGVLGFLIGERSRGKLHATSLLLILYGLTFILILDIDRPMAGSIKVSQLALQELAASMDRDAQRRIQPGANVR